ncbi:hypothetical protein [Mycolicibacterium houstonense]|uniref:hypothetical protein n=1 Tax=Mycolicibacterium houstonense TaxID=146021 RepID=UPI003F9E6FFE
MSGLTDDWDDGDDEAPAGAQSELDGLPEYADYPNYSFNHEGPEDDWFVDPDSPSQPSAGESNETVQTLLVTAEHPNGSIAATSLIDGRVFRVRLSSQVTKMTESELAEEIVKVCTRARRQAEAARHHIVASVMGELGQDPAATRSFLERTIGLPSPQTVLDEKARAFADYYSKHG